MPFRDSAAERAQQFETIKAKTATALERPGLQKGLARGLGQRALQALIDTSQRIFLPSFSPRGELQVPESQQSGDGFVLLPLLEGEMPENWRFHQSMYMPTVSASDAYVASGGDRTTLHNNAFNLAQSFPHGLLPWQISHNHGQAQAVIGTFPDETFVVTRPVIMSSPGVSQLSQGVVGARLAYCYTTANEQQTLNGFRERMLQTSPELRLPEVAGRVLRANFAAALVLYSAGRADREAMPDNIALEVMRLDHTSAEEPFRADSALLAYMAEHRWL